MSDVPVSIVQGMIDIPTGDCYSVDVNSAAHVFNKLRTFTKMEQKRHLRLKDKEEKVILQSAVFFQLISEVPVSMRVFPGHERTFCR